MGRRLAGLDGVRGLAALLVVFGHARQFEPLRGADGWLAIDLARLGADRWAALIGAHHEPGGDLLVVSAGTALTLDCLDRDGMFRGGTIAPGFALMRQSLARGTARLGYPEGDYAAYPQQTADAILSGCIDALVAPVERRAARFSADLGRPVRILIGGGDGMMLMSHLAVPAAIVDNLVLSGLALVAQPLC